jgi:hypothetical protein
MTTLGSQQHEITKQQQSAAMLVLLATVLIAAVEHTLAFTASSTCTLHTHSLQSLHHPAHTHAHTSTASS